MEKNNGYNITRFLRAGYASIFIEAIEIKRCTKTIVADHPFEVVLWDFVSGIENISKEREEANQIDNKKQSFWKTLICFWKTP